MQLNSKLIFKNLKKHINGIIYYVSIKKDKNQRKVVLHSTKKSNTKTQADRGSRNLTSKEKSKVTNEKIYGYLKKKNKFDIFKDAFDKQKNPNSKLTTLAPFMISPRPQDVKRCGNGLVAIVKNYMDSQDWKHNKKSTIRAKGFDKFSIDSGQLQQSIGWKMSFKRK